MGLEYSRSEWNGVELVLMREELLWREQWRWVPLVCGCAVWRVERIGGDGEGVRRRRRRWVVG
jgi:hypothetical protein